MRVEAKYILDVYAMSKGDSMHTVLKMVKFGTAAELGSKVALKILKFFSTKLNDPAAGISCLLNACLDAIRNFCCKGLARIKCENSPVLLNFSQALKTFSWI